MSTNEVGLRRGAPGGFDTVVMPVAGSAPAGIPASRSAAELVLDAEPA